MWFTLTIKFDKPSTELACKSIRVPIFMVISKDASNDDEFLKVAETWLRKPYIQQWFKGCRVIWIEGIGDVDLLVEDFI